jgi:hypothetical protein
MRSVIAGVLLAMMVGACGGSPAHRSAGQTSTSSSAPPTSTTTAAPCGLTTTPPSRYQHVVWVWMENHDWQQVLGDPSAAPFEAQLVRQCGTATDYHSVGSPSLPNYIAATSGSTQGISDDDSPSSHPLTVDNVFRQVRTSGGTERSYEESMTSTCQLAPAGEYAVKHNPAAYYVGGADRAACQADDVPLTAFATDLAAGHLPTFANVTPNLCHDTHDCSVATGDAWLAGWLPPLLASAEYRAGTTAVVVVWDEYTPMPNLIISPSVPPGTTAANPVDHYTLLGTTEDLLGLPRLGQAAGAASLRAAFRL